MSSEHRYDMVSDQEAVDLASAPSKKPFKNNTRSAGAGHLLLVTTVMFFGMTMGLSFTLFVVKNQRDEYSRGWDEAVREKHQAHYLRILRDADGGGLNQIVHAKCMEHAGCHVTRHRYLCFCDGRSFEGDMPKAPVSRVSPGLVGPNGTVRGFNLDHGDCFFTNVVQMTKRICEKWGTQCRIEQLKGWYMPVRQRFRLTGAANTLLELVENANLQLLDYTDHTANKCVTSQVQNGVWTWVTKSWRCKWRYLYPESEQLVYIKAGINFEQNLLLKGRTGSLKPCFQKLMFKSYDVAQVLNTVLDVWDIASSDNWKEVAQSGGGVKLASFDIKIRYCTGWNKKGRLVVDRDCTLLPQNDRRMVIRQHTDGSLPQCETQPRDCLGHVHGGCEDHEDVETPCKTLKCEL